MPFSSFRVRVARIHPGHYVKCGHKPQILHRAHLRVSQAAIAFVAWHPSLIKMESESVSRMALFFEFPHPTLPRIPLFSLIKSIGIESLRPNVFPAFVQVVQSSPSHLRITMNQGSSHEDSLELFSASLNQQRQQSVQSLQMQSHKSYKPRPTSVDIDTTGTRPLLRFSKPRELHL
ncbi:hypothetical protein P692DRAFT_20510790 [Suillus brevipes Sb2]|nr:hypothetical protein P692DRAFT_20510790 [Suillus brevipes Sb2]